MFRSTPWHQAALLLSRKFSLILAFSLFLSESLTRFSRIWRNNFRRSYTYLSSHIEWNHSDFQLRLPNWPRYFITKQIVTELCVRCVMWRCRQLPTRDAQSILGETSLNIIISRRATLSALCSRFSSFMQIWCHRRVSLISHVDIGRAHREPWVVVNALCQKIEISSHNNRKNLSESPLLLCINFIFYIVDLTLTSF